MFSKLSALVRYRLKLAPEIHLSFHYSQMLLGMSLTRRQRCSAISYRDVVVIPHLFLNPLPISQMSSFPKREEKMTLQT
jgi:hypothetical protein